MSPRRYKMDGARNEAAAATRRQILDATLRLHTVNGIFGTSWKDIAREANVSVATVYAHFPSLDALVPACGELMAELYRPPSPDDIDDILGDAIGPRDRLGRVARTLFGFYERAGASLETDPRERQLTAVQEWEAMLSGMVALFVETALGPGTTDKVSLAAITALFDNASYFSMRKRGLAPEDVARMVLDMATALPRQPRGQA